MVKFALSVCRGACHYHSELFSWASKELQNKQFNKSICHAYNTYIFSLWKCILPFYALFPILSTWKALPTCPSSPPTSTLILKNATWISAAPWSHLLLFQLRVTYLLCLQIPVKSNIIQLIWHSAFYCSLIVKCSYLQIKILSSQV